MKIKILLSLSLAFFINAEAKTISPPEDPQPSIQIALLLDTSSSMSGLINQAKTQLWKVVNGFTDAECDGMNPHVEVALYEYGNNALSVETNYIRLVQPFTRDLDEVSKKLFSLTTGGGEEYCGATIQRALADLQWNSHPKAYKTIFIAGNEPFTQGPVNAHKACRDGMQKGILVNTIHCGTREEGIVGQWNDGAALAGGQYLTINKDKAVNHIKAPQDAKISDLNKKLNDTYIPYGVHGESGKLKQLEADSHAEAYASSGAALQRSNTKITQNYCNSAWDLVDAVEHNQLKPETLTKQQLPEEFRDLNDAQLNAKIKEITDKRSEIQTSIKQLNAQRLTYISKNQAKKKDGEQATLDQAIVQTTRQQAQKLGYQFTKK
ncbi:vWA domain-containing protein [Rubritalea sp.]|uniref:vWA domain-containing protein n=1 Tax=Rubritalea sp. TaxID=2109375 RepID=UPI003EFAA5B8